MVEITTNGNNDERVKIKKLFLRQKGLDLIIPGPRKSYKRVWIILILIIFYQTSSFFRYLIVVPGPDMSRGPLLSINY